MKINIRFSIFYKYFFSYLIILFIPLAIIGGLLYQDTVINLRKEIETSNLTKLNKVKDIMDLQIKQLDEITIKISNNLKLAKCMLTSNDYKSYEGIEELSNYITNNAFIDDIFLYYRGDNSIYSSKGKCTIDVLINRLYRFDKWGFKQFYSDINTIAKRTVRRVEKVNLNDREQVEILTFLYPITPTSKNPNATVIITIRKRVLESLINDILEESQGSVYILNTNNEILVSKDSNKFEEKLEIINYLNDNKQQGITEITVENTKYCLLSTRSELTGWTYFIVMPTAQFLYRVHYSKTVVLQILLLVLVLGIVVTLILSINNYKPIKKLRIDIERYSSKNLNKYIYNEIDFIKNIMKDTIDENHKLIAQIDKQLPYIKEQGITMLLRGEINNDIEAGNVLNYTKLKLYGPYFCVIVVEIEESNLDYLMQNGRGNFFEVIKDYQILYDSYATRLIGENALVFVFNISSEDNHKFERCNLAGTLQNFFKEQFNLIVTIGVGKACHDLLELNRSFTEALAALEYKFIRGSGQIIVIDDIVALKKNSYWYPIEDKTRLIHALKQGNIEQYIEIVNDIKENIEERNLSLAMLRSICYDIVNSIIKTINDMNIDEIQNYVWDIIEFTSVNELSQKLINLGTSICKYIESSKESRNNELRDSIINYVNTNYKNYMLNLEQVAAQFNISPFYLSRFFKEQTGYCFVDYIRNLRIEETKRLLVQSTKSIKEIVRDVGYIDVSSFMRLFKFSEGITPGEYRKLYSKKKLEA
ncbi:MAG: helix-turn-helix domain-containing protein [Firmicutes bacterium]|nr:helix-turn-helix domain-containing protein [Bacillota bacterium]